MRNQESCLIASGKDPLTLSLSPRGERTPERPLRASSSVPSPRGEKDRMRGDFVKHSTLFRTTRLTQLCSSHPLRSPHRWRLLPEGGELLQPRIASSLAALVGAKHLFGNDKMKTSVENEFNNFDVLTIRPCVAEERDDLYHCCLTRGCWQLKNITGGIVRQSKDAIFISSGDGRFVDVNQPLLDRPGYEVEEMVGEHIQDICVNAADGDKLQQEVQQKGYVID